MVAGAIANAFFGVSIPERVLEALKLTHKTKDLRWGQVSIPERVLEALKRRTLILCLA